MSQRSQQRASFLAAGQPFDIESRPHSTRISSDAPIHLSWKLKDQASIAAISHLQVLAINSKHSSMQKDVKGIDEKCEIRNTDIFVDFEEGDPANPINWPRSRKWLITLFGIWFTFLVSAASSSFSVGLPQMTDDLKTSRELSLVGLSFYPLGFALTPLVLAPFSEVYGRSPMYIWTAGAFSVFTLIIGFSPNITTVILARFLSGCAGSTGSTMVGGSLSDMWLTHERGLPMSIFSAAAFIGVGVGPAAMGYVAQQINWRWIQFIQAILGFSTFFIYLLFMRETRGCQIVSRRAAQLRLDTGLQNYKCKADDQRASLKILIKGSLSRPLYLLVTEPVVFFFSLWASFAWGVMFGLLEAIPLVMERYGAKEGEIGLAFLAIVAGAFAGACANPLQEAMYRKRVAAKGIEARLYGACLGGVLLPTGCFIFAWTQGRVHWIVPLIGISILIMGTYWIYCAVFNYLADSYLAYASSAIAAQSFARNMMAFAYPLFTTQLYQKLGYAWASTLFGIVGTLLAIIPFVLLFKGREIRARSRFVREMQS